ncbi:hypothetical protein EVJ24_14940 [Exiguobacterium sp. SH1S21]|uniref:hypothetical protein n=1 Tax=Exiguobacterium sp. SH1S21 TaxID=2510953 RepID=UPI00103BA135|nr:hypothetical protein [Exiguobacterium sp. SH1S21]TCI50302.1 hypothetical protein EVJ24_14940 [Exiguobacterium sp. SH1S21]
MKKSAYELMAQGYEELRLKEQAKENGQEAGFIQLNTQNERPFTAIEKMMQGYDELGFTLGTKQKDSEL